MVDTTRDDEMGGTGMNAGRALDVEIQRVIFGAKHIYCRYGQPWTGDDWPFYISSGKPWRTHSIDALPVPKYSTDIAATWLVVERMRKQGTNLRIEMLDPLTEEFDRYTIEVGPWSMNVDGVPNGPRHTVQADTASLAICLAALRATGEGG